MTKLQQELYDLMADEIRRDLMGYVPGLIEENLDAFLEDLREDICTMDAVDLRRNIKIWKEDISFGRQKR